MHRARELWLLDRCHKHPYCQGLGEDTYSTIITNTLAKLLDEIFEVEDGVQDANKEHEEDDERQKTVSEEEPKSPAQGD